MKLPYTECSDPQLIKEGVRAGEREDFASDFPNALKAMIERAWHQDPKQRPPIDECVRNLEQFLAKLAPDVAGVGHGGSCPSSLSTSLAFNEKFACALCACVCVTINCVCF
jgi:hypothetical protein